MEIPRPEYPRPQFVRKEWLCLNGEWQFEIDYDDYGLERGLLDRELKDTIVVPFCPESPLSGVNNKDFMNAVWYRRTVKIPEEWKGKRVFLNFQAVDYDATVWVNGREVRRHRGGFTPFSCDLEKIAEPGSEITLVVRARDYPTTPQPRGKQSTKRENWSCFYTRTTGIWQTVWMEPVPSNALKRPRITPDVGNGIIRLEQPITSSRPGLRLRGTLSYGRERICTEECPADRDFSPVLYLHIPEEHRHLWSPGNPILYDLEIELTNARGKTIDRARSYAGLRSVTIDGKAVKINGETVFQRLVLDQGYYPDGIMTAPNDEALERDIKLSMDAGFNGARLHEKVFEERFLYHADRLGYLVWGEFADWGCSGFGPENDHHRISPTHITQWLEVMDRDYSHPCIIGWCPMNEAEQVITDKITTLEDAQNGMFLAARAIDSTRPVLDTSGYSHLVPESDIYDCHDYEQHLEKFKMNRQGLAEGKTPITDSEERPISIPYRGQPYFISEFGGIWWNPDASDDENSWGYGEHPKTIEEFYQRFKSLCDVLLDNPDMFGYCYTQLTDVFQEQNGIFTFNRKSKFDLEILCRIQQREAAIEKLNTRDLDYQ